MNVEKIMLPFQNAAKLTKLADGSSAEIQNNNNNNASASMSSTNQLAALGAATNLRNTMNSNDNGINHNLQNYSSNQSHPNNVRTASQSAATTLTPNNFGSHSIRRWYNYD